MQAVEMHPKMAAIGHRLGLPEWPEARRKIWLPAQNRCPSGKVSRCVSAGWGRKSQYCSGSVGSMVRGLGTLGRAEAGGCNAPKMAAIRHHSGLPEWPEARCIISAHLGRFRGVSNAGW